MVAWPVEFFSQLASKHETKSAKAVRTGRGSTMVFVSLFSIVSLFHGRISSETAVESILNVLTYPL
jgi:hypothetical protein